MKILKVVLRGYKRFRTSGIREFEASFHSPVVIITGSNNSGKSSLLKELCPLPSVRTDYEQGGFKELTISHNGRQYIVTSDFSNRVSPHSFRLDGLELNTSGTTDVQTELVEKHFGITPVIRNLIYSKITLCQTTKNERKNLFLSINPLELGLILDTHKKVSSESKKYKSQLQLLYSRKADVEGKMLSPDAITAYSTTRENLLSDIGGIDKIINVLEQHILSIKNSFHDDISYRTYCLEHNTILIPLSEIKMVHLEITRSLAAIAGIDKEQSEKEMGSLTATRSNLITVINDVTSRIENLSKEINEYTKHLENANNKSVSAIEEEILCVEKTIKKYKGLPAQPVPEHQYSEYVDKSETIKTLAFFFNDLPVKMLPPEELSKKEMELSSLKATCLSLNQQLSMLSEALEREEQELKERETKAGIPDDCSFETCGLRKHFRTSTEKLRSVIKIRKEKIETITKELDEKNKLYSRESEFLEPYISSKAIQKYYDLYGLVTSGYFCFRSWDDFFTIIKDEPLRIVQLVGEFLSGSKLSYEKNMLEKRLIALNTELQATLKSNETSSEFLQKKINEKEKEIATLMQTLHKVENDNLLIEEKLKSHQLFKQLQEKLQSTTEAFERGKRALLVTKSLSYWTKLLDYFQQAKNIFNEELRKVESIVREQELLTHTYKNEIMTYITEIESKKRVLEKVELALSPTTGLPHKSMVQYLNAMINNVNYFLSQIWTSRMCIRQLEKDQPLDYGFKMEVGQELRPDINSLSDGQTEVMNLCWVLTILLQMRLLDKIPLFADELGRTFDPTHRIHILRFIGRLIDDKLISQLFLVNHYAVFTDGFPESDVICLHSENIPELPQNVNEHVKILN